MISPLRSGRARTALALVALALAFSCGGDGDAELQRLGALRVAITEAPADVSCIFLTVDGSRFVERSFDVLPGQSTELLMTSLPVGEVAVEGFTFDVPCDSVMEGDVPGWQGGPVAAVLASGQETPVTLPMRRSARALIAVDFEEESCLVDGSACSAGSECCSGFCDVGGCAPSAACGDGVVDPGEECDDGFETNTCDVDCTAAVCGDGVTNVSAGESCDGGGTETETCNADCSTSLCGDGITNETEGESCDDGNLVDGDGCSSSCQSEGA